MSGKITRAMHRVRDSPLAPSVSPPPPATIPSKDMMVPNKEVEEEEVEDDQSIIILEISDESPHTQVLTPPPTAKNFVIRCFSSAVSSSENYIRMRGITSIDTFTISIGAKFDDAPPSAVDATARAMRDTFASLPSSTTIKWLEISIDGSYDVPAAFTTLFSLIPKAVNALGIKIAFRQPPDSTIAMIAQRKFYTEHFAARAKARGQVGIPVISLAHCFASVVSLYVSYDDYF